VQAVPEFCVVVQANHPFGRLGRWSILAASALASIAVVARFAAAGAWPVLPYSVLKLALLALAFRGIERRADDWERLAIAWSWKGRPEAVGGGNSIACGCGSNARSGAR